MNIEAAIEVTAKTWILKSIKESFSESGLKHIYVKTPVNIYIKKFDKDKPIFIFLYIS